MRLVPVAKSGVIKSGIGAWLIVLLCASVLPAAAADHTVTLDQAPIWSRELAGTVVRWPGLPLLDDPDAPALPYHDVTILLPPGESLSEVRVQPAEVAVRPLDAPMAPGRPPLSDQGDTAAGRTVPDGGAPQAWGEVLGTSTWHGYQLGHVRIHPVRLRETADGPVAEHARTFRLTTSTRPSTRASVLRQRAVPGEELRLRSVLGRHVLGAELAAAYPQAAASAAAKTLEGYRPTDAPSLDGSDVRFVIVTTEALRPAFEPLAEYRCAQGVPTVVRTLEWILANTLPEADPQATLRSFLADAYTRWGVRYALLGGDVGVIPTRMIFNTYYPSQKGSDIPVDLYYGGLDGDWNADRDENLGEPYLNGFDQGDDADLVPEIHVGRAPVTSLAQAQTFVGKILAYERDHAGAYQGRALFLSEVLFPSDYSPGDEIYDDGAAYSEAIIADALAGRDFAYDRHYETSPLWPGSVPETRSGVIGALNSGQYGIVNHIGHGYFYNMSVGAETLNTKDAEALHNGDQLFVLNNLNCASAAIDYNSIMERFVTNADGGAVAAVGSSRAAFPSTASGYQANFFDGIFVQGLRTLGEAVNAMRTPYDGQTFQNTVQRWTHMTLVLVGDPTLRLYGAAPTDLAVAAPAALSPGRQDVTVDVTRGGAPVAGAAVCFWKDGDDYRTALTDAAGRVVAPVHLRGAGTLRITATAADSPPLEIVVPVDAGLTAYPALAGLTVVDDGSLGTLGNGDGVPGAGETVALLTDWTNAGGADAAAAGTLALSCDDPLVNVLTAGVDLPALAAGATGAAAAPVLLQLAATIPDRSEFRLDFTAAWQSGPVAQPSMLEVVAPRMEPGQMAFNDYPHGDGDGLMEPGELVRLKLSLLNTGWGLATGLVGWIDPSDPNITVVQGIGTWPQAGRNQEVEQEQEFLLSMAAVNGTVEAVLHLADSLGQTWEHRFSLNRPATPVISEVESSSVGEILLVWDPNAEADLLGYHVQRAASSSGPYERLTLRPITGGAFFRDIGLDPLTRYFYKVAAVDSSRFVSAYSLPISVSTPPAEQTGFPITMPVETSSHIAVGDVNGDGALEVVTAAEAIYVWTADGNELLDGDNDPTTLGPFVDNGETWTPAGIVLADITDDPGLEIVASCRSTNAIYVFESDGAVAPGWPRTMNNWNWATPCAGDIDGDGLAEVVVNTIRNRTYAWNHDGTEVLDGDGDPATDGVFHERVNEWYSFATPSLADLDGDGAAEVIFGTRSSDTAPDELLALRADGTQPAGWPVLLGIYGEAMDSPAVGDWDRDGDVEIVLITEDDKLHVLDRTGAHEPGFPIAFIADNNGVGQSCPSPALGDMDGDGLLEIVAVAVDDATHAMIHVIGRDGLDLPGWPKAVGGSSESSPILGDVTGDGLPDVIYGIGGASDSQENLLYAFRNDGATIPGFPLSLSGPVRATPTLTDLNGDGDVDLVYAGWDLAVHVWDFPAPWNEAAAAWPTFHGDVQRRGVTADLTISAVAEPSPLLPQALVLEPCAPNPFNPATTIRFALPADVRGRTRLRVFDLQGRLVRTLVDGVLPAGFHEVAWRGRDDRDRAVGSGVYLYRLEAGGVAAQGRMTLVK
ncbi:MAG TPA: C25 family cysteine peptidase [Candidatus Krumholzibacteria bacterium]|nr:C25 family cysteine peptidase [Candidatus Krumholzibacteria bacterium]